MTIDEARQLAETWIETNQFAMRSCWNCNQGHNHLKLVDYVFFCFWCGGWFYKGFDITIR